MNLDRVRACHLDGVIQPDALPVDRDTSSFLITSANSLAVTEPKSLPFAGLVLNGN